jgi:hypothetical protein
MNKTIQLAPAILILSSITANVLAFGISFEGPPCVNEGDRGDSRFISGSSSVSKITVTGTDPTKDLFLIAISGGIPRMDENEQFACIEKTIPFGHSGADPQTITDSSNIMIPIPNESVNGVAWWNGDDLIVTFSALYFAEGPVLETAVRSSVIFPTSHIMIFNLDENNNFRLVQFTGSVGQVSSLSANTNSEFATEAPFYIDTLVQSIFIASKPKNVFYTLFE